MYHPRRIRTNIKTMKYFQNITHLEQAKKRFRMLATQLHPDKGGSAKEFDEMQQEYKTFLINFQNQQGAIDNQTAKPADIMEELGKLAKVLIEKQVPQKYLKQKIKNSQSSLEKGLFFEIVSFLDRL